MPRLRICFLFVPIFLTTLFARGADPALDTIPPVLLEERVAVIYDFTAPGVELEPWVAGPTAALTLTGEGLVCSGEEDDPYFFPPIWKRWEFKGILRYV